MPTGGKPKTKPKRKQSAKQKANTARFKKVIENAKKIRQKNPKLAWKDAVKKAWAEEKKKKGGAPRGRKRTRGKK